MSTASRAAGLYDAISQAFQTVRGINRIVYDVTSKPSATIEWE